VLARVEVGAELPFGLEIVPETRAAAIAARHGVIWELVPANVSCGNSRVGVDLPVCMLQNVGLGGTEDLKLDDIV